MITEQLIVLTITFFLIATLYSSAGFGGGSSYLAVMALLGVNFMMMKSIALLCNIVVVSGNLIVFHKANLLDLRKSVPLILLSVPLAFLGGAYPLHSGIFFILLGGSLVIAALLLFISKRDQPKESKTGKQLPAMMASGGLGFLSGLVGIGGGIFLSPILNLIHWDNSKRIAATASLFIFVNSIAGLAGHFTRSTPHYDLFQIIPIILAVALGGQLGSRLTTYKFKLTHVKLVTALLVLFAGVKILYDHL